jgi:hypothetical protein
MITLHLIGAITVLVANLVAGVWGALSWYRRKPSVGFWYVLRVAQIAVVIQLAFGAILVLEGRVAPDGLHYLYGVLPVVVSLLAEGARALASQHELEGLDLEALDERRRRAVAMAISRRETGIMAVSCLVILGLAIRAAFLSSVI